ncbi:hypothetical protein VKT23_011696 [Stygiomarasmius scandens]|uniref:Uncharacterized protein n=1 Tax=Marasmiellus scandens TaxID=2682957 RepID=A0ABR1JAD0_9AGAR
MSLVLSNDQMDPKRCGQRTRRFSGYLPHPRDLYRRIGLFALSRLDDQLSSTMALTEYDAGLRPWLSSPVHRYNHAVHRETSPQSEKRFLLSHFHWTILALRCSCFAVSQNQDKPSPWCGPRPRRGTPRASSPLLPSLLAQPTSTSRRCQATHVVCGSAI